MPNFTLSIVSHGHAEMLVPFLYELDSQSSLKGVKLIITLNIDEKFPLIDFINLNVIFLKNNIPKGFGENHNNAFKICYTDWFVVLNPDLLLHGEEPFTNIISKYSINHNNIGILAPKILNSTGNLEDSVRENLTPFSIIKRYLFCRKKNNIFEARPEGTDFFWFAGMCLVINSSAFKHISGFDRHYFLYCEDYDLCARLYASGFSLIYCDQCSIIHNAQRDSHKSFTHLRWHLKSLIRVWTSKIFWKIVFKRFYCPS